MNKKGFTLVEVLSVIVILSLIIVIVATKGFGAFNNTKDKIAELNNKAVEEGLELLKLDIENCNDELDNDVYNGIFGKNSCQEMMDNINGYEISLGTLIEKGYVEGAGVEEINNKEYQTYSTVVQKDENDKVSFDEFKTTELIAYMQKDILKGNVAKEKIVKIEFVNYVDNDAVQKWDITTGSSNEKVYAWVEDVGTDTYNLYVGSKGKIYAPSDSSWMFSDYNNITYINLNNLDTANVKTMYAMFMNCNNLKNVTFAKNFNTANVTSLGRMFQNCSSLEKLDISKFDTNEVTEMGAMFESCSKISEIKFGDKFIVNPSTSMGWMFYNCNSLEELDLSTFKSDNNTNVSNMFYGANNLKRVYFKEGTANKLENALPSSVEKIYK